MICKNAFEKIKTMICRHLIAKSEKCLAKRRREECVEDRVDARVGVRQHVASDLISGLVDFLLSIIVIGWFVQELEYASRGIPVILVMSVIL